MCQAFYTIPGTCYLYSIVTKTICEGGLIIPIPLMRKLKQGEFNRLVLIIQLHLLEARLKTRMSESLLLTTTYQHCAAIPEQSKTIIF